MVDIAFCPGFAPTKITSSQWKHLSTLIVKKLLVVKPWSDEQRLIPKSEACFGEIPVIINSEGLPMVFVKDLTKWVHHNCSISAPTRKRNQKVLQVTLPHHLDQYLSLSLVLLAMLVFQANVLGQGRTLKIQLLTRLCPLLLPLSTYTPHSTLFSF
ncbi:uncharacterized protein LACBIDRAFT_331421 [Laccaria bicolor S238N-H82]|uniref:Predicted protein n=1 Tax=Laccaria bicolor (strain S238N-H82 / ATCC MYA-4686) TaxID=486041 RepID=B0DPF2_LACBS|nr:uncharacterized protein LACBIDRAFT_331421 [Laccaria bicolor S238N-H82]EDR03674.1 predicted protein [Laccaria bicolor S238N-H82]|eukprot:XP_001885822.1 predicted protein [Laccaria bicolor S238N-H82]